MTIRLWVPGTIPPGLIERAVEAAWPGAHTVTAPAGPPLPARRRGGRRDAAAGPPGDPARCRPAMTRRRRCGRWPAPRPGSATASTPSCRSWPARSPGPGCARPAAPPAGSASGQPARLASRLLDLATPGPRHQPQPGPRPRRPRAGRRDPRATAKLAGPQWETLIRYAVATTAAVQIPRRGRAVAGPGRRRPGAGPAARPGPRPGLGDRAADRAELAGPPPAAPPRRRDRLPPAGPGATCCRSPNSRRSPGCPPTRRCPAWPAPGHAPSRRRPPSRCPAPASARSASPTPGAPRPVGLAVPDARHHLRICRADRHRQDHPDRRADPRRRRRRTRRRLHRPQGRRRDRRPRPPPRERRGQGRAVRPRRPGRAAVPERAARRRHPAPTPT